MNCEVHFGYADRLICFFLSVDRHFARRLYFLAVLEMPFDKLHRLHEHTARSARRIVDISLVWLADFYDELDDRSRCEKFPTTGPVRNCELTKKVFINSPERIALNIVRNLIEIFKKRNYGPAIQILK